LIPGIVNLLRPIFGAPQGKTQQAGDAGGLIPGIVNFLSPFLGAGQGESQKIDEPAGRGPDKTGQNKSDKVEPVGREPVDAKYCRQFPNDSRCRGGDQTNTGGLPDEFKAAQDAQVGCMLTFVPAIGGWSAVAYHSILSPDPYNAISELALKPFEHAPSLLKDNEMVKKFGVTQGHLERVRKVEKYARIPLALPDCIKLAKDSGVIGEFGLTKDLGLNKPLEMLGLSPGPSDTSKGGGIILSCNQFPGQSVDEIQRNCQEVSQNQSGPQTTERPTFFGKDYPSKGYTPP
jgi:hypothetical protein